MPDPLSIAASVAGLITLAMEVAKATTKYWTSVKDCPKHVGKLQNELSAMQKTLERLAPLAGTLPSLTQLQTELDECETTLQVIQDKLEKGFNKKTKVKGGFRFRWPLDEKEVKDAIASLGRYQDIFQLALQTDTA